MRKLVIALSALSLIAGSAPALAATHCRESKGNFIKCPSKPAAKAAHCRDAKGKFVKCGTKGAKPV